MEKNTRALTHIYTHVHTRRLKIVLTNCSHGYIHDIIVFLKKNCCGRRFPNLHGVCNDFQPLYFFYSPYLIFIKTHLTQMHNILNKTETLLFI